MMLCLDCGNTRIKWALRRPEGSGWLASGALATVAAASLRTALPAAPSRVVACNVAGPAGAAALEAALGLPIEWQRASAAQCGVTNGYAQPERLGADRWAALIGAWHLRRGPALVVCAGTATTIDVLDAQGIFRGGLILPGLDLMAEALAGNTAGLQTPPGEYAELPTTTADAISAGALHATLGAIARMASRLPPASPLLLSGGAADRLQPLLPAPLQLEPRLILEGLACIAGLADNSP